MKDPYVEKAKQMNYRCRSAFKLLEIDNKFHIIRPGEVILDIGAAPGSWTQVAVERANLSVFNKKFKGVIISVDVLPFEPIAGATALIRADITKLETVEKIKGLLGPRLANCILSDMAPNATGIKHLDHDSITNLCYHVLKLSSLISEDGGNILMKAWDGGNISKLEKEILKTYEIVRRIKPKSSRQDSAEIYLLGQHFKRQHVL
ncbi:rRNA methyltransferase 2, mitochondrial [Condylostylus longicornis]|uniref:rRNA methyltransferase 2, mitochondrial n=1 Tax=Condylostylus longicornis TaxID=2530218 RepID=UPI00244DB374|nr:rRNA methyltransferase 2, mitochondrial [Condylostylus longicornis]